MFGPIATLLRVVLAAPAAPAGGGAGDSNGTITEQEALRSEQARYAAQMANDFAAMDRLFGDDLVYIHSSTVLDTKTSFIESMRSGIVRYRRGAKGSYWLAKPADTITIADVVRAVEGPIAHVQSAPPESIEYRGNAEHLQELWIAVRANLRAVVEHVTLEDLVTGDLPPIVEELSASPDAWAPR